MNPPSKRRLPLLAKAAIAFGILLLLLVLAFSFWRMMLASQNAGRLRAIKAAAEPASARELDTWYPSVNEKENAALLWLDGIAKLKPKLEKNRPAPWSTIKSPPRGSRFAPGELAQAAEIVTQNKESLALFRRAAALRQSRYPIDLSQSVFAELPHLTLLKSSAGLLQLEALVNAHNHRGPDAAESIQALLGAGRSLSDEPAVISQLVRIALDHMAVSCTERALHLVPLAEAQLAALQRAFAEADTPEGFTRALIGERASTVTIMDSPQEIKPPANDAEGEETVKNLRASYGSPVARLTGFFQRDLGFYLDAMGTNIAISKLPDPEKFTTRTNLESIELRARRGFYIMSSLLLPALSRLVARDVEHRARMRVAQAAMAVERYRLANQGRIPASLAALVPKYLPAVPIDPFDGQPLRFKPGPTGYVVYSLGPDANDDGGVERPPGTRSDKTPYDVTFIMER